MEKINSLQDEWEEKLKKLGMPAEPLSEQAVATSQNERVELVPKEMASREAEELAQKLAEEDPRNILGGFPNTMDMMVSLVETMQKELLEKNIPAENIRIIIHPSCINEHDCVTLTYSGNNGNVYHYNTKNISGYSRQGLISKMGTHGLSVVEK